MERPSVSLNVCPICSANSAKTVIKFDCFSVMKCPTCQSSWRSNMYDHDTIRRMYGSEDYAKDPFFAHVDSSLEESPNQRLIHYDKALAYVESQGPVGKLLDVGCGTGAFLSVAKRRGWSVAGIDLSPALCEMCRSKGFDVSNVFFEEADLPEKSYNLITFWDTIEHVLDPNSCIEKARSLLAPGGILVFCTPNEESLLARIGIFLAKYTPYYYPALALHPPNHTHFFGWRSFAALLAKSNLQVIKCCSQRAFFEHSSLASRTQKMAIDFVERIAGAFDTCYDMVVFAKVAYGGKEKQVA